MGFELTTYMYGWSLCRKPRPQVQRSNTCSLRQWIQTLSRLLRRAAVYGGPILLFPSPDGDIIISRIATFKTTIYKSSWNLNTH